jgi:hypothetical protein
MQKYGETSAQPLSAQERDVLFTKFMKFLAESKSDQAAAR